MFQLFDPDTLEIRNLNRTLILFLKLTTPPWIFNFLCQDIKNCYIVNCQHCKFLTCKFFSFQNIKCNFSLLYAVNTPKLPCVTSFFLFYPKWYYLWECVSVFKCFRDLIWLWKVVLLFLFTFLWSNWLSITNITFLLI